MAGQPDEFELESFVEKLCELLEEFNAEDFLNVPNNIIAVSMWNHALNLSEATEKYLEFLAEEDNEGN